MRFFITLLISRKVERIGDEFDDIQKSIIEYPAQNGNNKFFVILDKLDNLIHFILGNQS